MSSNNSRSHRGINLDDIEKHIRESAAHPAAGGGAAEDPLAELSRIVSGGPVTRRDTRLDLSRNEARRSPSAAPADSFAPRAATPANLDLPLGKEEPAAPSRSQFSTIEDDINRLLRQNQPAAQPAPPPRPEAPRRPDDLETAMRSLDNLLRAKQAPAQPVKQSGYEDWSLRPSEPEFEPLAAATPATALSEPQVTYAGDDLQTYSDNPPPDMAPASWPAEDGPEPEYDAAAQSPSRSRRPLFMVAAILGVAAIGVGGALSMRGGDERAAGGQPPIIVADKGPAKVVPENPGGLVIPDQNRQILERSPTETQRPAKVVNSEEQPLDLKAAVRRELAATAKVDAPKTVASLVPPQATAAAPVVISPPPPAPVVAAPAAPAAPSFSDAAAIQPQDSRNSALEPRRVRTVAIKPPEPGSATIEPVEPLPPAKVVAPPPQAKVAPPAPETKAVASAAPAPVPPPVVAAPAAAPAQPASEAAAPPAPPKPKMQGSIGASREVARHTPKPAGRTNDDVTASTGPLQITPPQARASAADRHPQRVAAVEPTPPAASPFAAPQPKAASAGDYVVQLASEVSDAGARAAISRLQSRYAELGPFVSSVQKREVRGSMRYRVRFGSMSREAAGALCASLKSKGQDCILQPN